jgi:hypothetical protein
MENKMQQASCKIDVFRDRDENLSLRSLRRTVLLVGIILWLQTGPAPAEVRIHQDFGGQIGHYLDRYAALRDQGDRVVIDGQCLSACTLALGMIPPARICVTRNAVLGFHAAWMPGDGEQPLQSADGTRLLMRTYPLKVREWIRRQGGLSRKVIFLRGRELEALFPRCSSPWNSAARNRTLATGMESAESSVNRAKYGARNGKASYRLNLDH